MSKDLYVAGALSPFRHVIFRGLPLEFLIPEFVEVSSEPCNLLFLESESILPPLHTVRLIALQLTSQARCKKLST